RNHSRPGAFGVQARVWKGGISRRVEQSHLPLIRGQSHAPILEPGRGDEKAGVGAAGMQASDFTGLDLHHANARKARTANALEGVDNLAPVGRPGKVSSAGRPV